MWREYHIVKKTDINKRVARPTDCVKEIRGRQTFTKKYFNGRYDARHKHWMTQLAANVSTAARINMSLDDVIAVQRAENA